MKRIKAACLEQTVYFTPKDNGEDRAAEAKVVAAEVSHYKALMDRRRIKYSILSENTLEDGSIVLKLKRQYNDYPVGEYMS